MSLRGRRSLGCVLIIWASLLPALQAGDASARGRGMGARPQAHVSRTGPAGGGSFRSDRARGRGRDDRRNERPRANEVPAERADQRDRGPGRDRRLDDRSDGPSRRTSTQERGEGRRDEYRDRRDDGDRQDRYENRRDRYENRQDYYDDRRDYYRDRRAFARGARYSASWWSSSCSRVQNVVVDGYTYYECDGTWFSRTYYGGEVVYTVVDAPPGY